MNTEEIQDSVAEILATWVRLSTAATRFPRVNLRFILSERSVSERVRKLLEPSPDVGRFYCVRTSADAEAVLYRNGTPSGADPQSTFVFVLFWTPGVPGHEHNAQSLQDLRAVDVRDVLAGDMTFELPLEAAVARQVDESARSWPEANQTRAREHLRAAWRSLTQCLRTRHGGRERSVPFLRSMESYVRFLDAARVPQSDWESFDAAERPSKMVRRWGRALVELQMFQMPEIANVLGVATSPSTPVPVPSKTKEAWWVTWIEQSLAENLEYALDPTGLGDALAGKSELDDQLERLKQVPLCRDEKTQLEARAALLKFCRDNDDAALRLVDWIFYKDPANRRTQSFGLRGLLMARNQRAPRMSPLERARQDTLEMFERSLGKNTPEFDEIRRFVEEQSASGAKGLQVLCDALSPLTSGELPDLPEVRQLLERAINAPGWRVKTALQVTARWERLRKRDSNDRVEDASTVLQALLRLLWRWTSDRTEPDSGASIDATAKASGLLLVRYEGRGAQATDTVTLDPSAPAKLLRDLRDFLVKKVQPLVYEEFSRQRDEDAEDEDDDQGQTLGFFVERGAGRDREPIGRIEVPVRQRAARLWKASRGDVLLCWEQFVTEDQSHVGGVRLLDQLERAVGQNKSSCSPNIPTIDESWSNYVMDCKGSEGWEFIAPLAPVPDAARRWVEAWAQVLKEIEASVASEHANAEIQRLRNEREAAIEAEEFARVKILGQSIKEQEAKAEAAAKPLPKEVVRKTLAQNTVVFREREGQPLRTVLSPHHPLVVRLRALEDDLFAEVLQKLWAGTWPDDGRHELQEALEKNAAANWGLPEPMHAWCTWDGEPLVFEGWLDGSWCAFSKLESGRDADAATIGVHTVSHVVSQYRTLFPSAADRLRLRIRGDREGAWAWQILDDRLKAKDGFAADVDLVTELSEREPTVVDTAVLHHRAHLSSFELGSNGALPRVRVRRVRPTDGRLERAHMTLAVGEQINALHAEWKEEAPTHTPAASSPWQPSVLFHETLPEARGTEEIVRDPEDALCHRVAIAMGIARGHAGRVTVERHSFDPSRCEVPLRSVQAGAHWLVLASRRPLYRAVQQVGARVATLLDFRTVIERGRAVHVAVSLNAERDREDLLGFAARLRSLTGEGDITIARAVVRFAQRVAPGLALRAIASAGGGDLVGLLGLLLSAHVTLEQQDNGIALSLDQHASLLERGMRGDLLVVRLTQQGVGLSVVESKCSVDRLDSASSRTNKATMQLAATIEGLQRFRSVHPLSARSRMRLARALIHQGHMLAIEDGRAEELAELVQRVRSPSTAIDLGPSTANVVLMWSFSDQSEDHSEERDAGKIRVFGRQSTLERLRKIVQDHQTDASS